MLSTTDPGKLIGGTVYDRDHDKIGTINQVYVDSVDGRPTWASVRTGLFGLSETFVPLEDATETGDEITLDYEKDFVKDAPRIDPDGDLDDAQQDELYSYYHRSGSAGAGIADHDTATTGTASTGAASTGTADYDTAATGTAGYEATGATAGTAGYDATSADADVDGAATTGVDRSAGHDTSGANTDDAMTRSEERLRVGTAQEQSGRARLRKYVVTDTQTVNVPVSHEEVRLEREPITDANASSAYDGPALSDEEHEVTLHAERPVVEKETVPVERVRLGTETVTEDATVTEDVAHEEIEFDGDDAQGRRGADGRGTV
jgi:uncharacterized protein (TIGR02271 family)